MPDVITPCPKPRRLPPGFAWGYGHTSLSDEEIIDNLSAQMDHPMRRTQNTARAVKPRILERDLQCAAANFLRPLMADGVLLFLHVPNEGKRSPAQGQSLKRQGMMPGWPDNDIHIFGKERILIELKLKGNKLTEIQEDCHALLRTFGHSVYTVTSDHPYDTVAQFRTILRNHGVAV